jgi:cobalt-zinc-cadmium efflux system outer membrane protein
MVAWSQTVITESDAVGMALARIEVADLERGTLQMAEADERAAGQWPNPSLSYQRETMGDSPESIEESWMISQSFDFSGRRGLRREAAGRRVEVALADNAARRVELAAEIRRTFHNVLFQQEVVRATAIWVDHFQRIEVMVEKLAKAGEASGYDRRRLLRARQLAEAGLQAHRAELARELARLTALTGMSGDPEVAGELLPPAPLPLEQAMPCLEQRPDLLALSHRAQAAELEGRAARRGAIPDLTVGFGPKRVDNGTVQENGMVLSLSVPLPLFDRQQAGLQRAVAEATQAQASLRLARSRAEGDLQGLHRQVEGLRATAIDYRSSAVATSPELVRVAESAYRGGESSLLELLDAHRGALESEIAALELEQRARLAYIEYDMLTGSSECKL